MKSQTLLVLLIILTITVSAQNLNMSWINPIISPNYEKVMDMQVDHLDDVIISAVNSDTLILGVDTLAGNNVFIARFSSAGNYKGLVFKYKPTSGAWYNLAISGDNSIYSWNRFSHNTVFNGDSILTHSADNLIIVKWNPAGNVLWHREILKTTYLSPYGYSSYIKDMSSDQEGNLYLLCKFEEALVIEGDTLIPNYSWCNSISNFSYLLIKYNPQGDMQWYKRLGFDNANSYLETDDHGNPYLICSFKDSLFVGQNKIINGNKDGIFVGKFLSTGNLLNHKEFYRDNAGTKMHAKIQDNKIVMVEMVWNDILIDSLLIQDSLWGYHVFIAEMDTNLNLQKHKMIGYNFDGCFPYVVKNQYGGYHVITHNNSYGDPIVGGDTLYNIDNAHDITWMYLDSSFNYQGYKVIGGPNNDYLHHIEPLSGGGIIGCGDFTQYLKIDNNTYYLDSLRDIVLFSMDYSTSIDSEINQSFIFKVYPNPTNSIINVILESKEIKSGELRIYNIHGQMMKYISLSVKQQTLSADISSLSPGLYLVCLTSDNQRYCQKIIKQ